MSEHDLHRWEGEGGAVAEKPDDAADALCVAVRRAFEEGQRAMRMRAADLAAERGDHKTASAIAALPLEA